MLNSDYDNFNDSLRLNEKFYNQELIKKKDYEGDDEEDHEWNNYEDEGS